MSLQIPKTSSEWIQFLIGIVVATGIGKIIITAIKDRMEAMEAVRKRQEIARAEHDEAELKLEISRDQMELEAARARDRLLVETFGAQSKRIEEAEERARVAERRVSELLIENRDLIRQLNELKKHSEHDRGRRDTKAEG